MSSRSETPLTADQVGQLWELFGPPPVLSSENLDAYHHLAKECVLIYQPTNSLQLRMIREVVDADWESFRCGRHRTLAIERNFRKEVEGQVSCLQQMNANKKRKIEQISKYTHDDGEKHQLQTSIQATEANIAKISQKAANEIDHNRALERGAAFLDHLEDWQNGARARRSSALQLLEYARAKTFCDDQKIIDAPYKEVDKPQIGQTASPAIVPAKVSDHDVTAENYSEPAELPKE